MSLNDTLPGKNLRIVSNDRGFTIIETTIVAGIIGIVALGLSTVIVNQQKAMTTLENKQEAIDTKNLLLQILSDGDKCSWQLKGKTVDVAAATTEKNPSKSEIGLTAIYSGDNDKSPEAVSRGESIGSRASSPIVDSIKFKEVFEVGDDSYQGKFVISLRQAKINGGMAIKPIEVSAIIETDPDSPKGKKKILSCGAGAGGGGGGNWCGYGSFGWGGRGGGIMGMIEGHGVSIKEKCLGKFPTKVKPASSTRVEVTEGGCPTGYKVLVFGFESSERTCQGGKEGSDYSNCSGGGGGGNITCIKKDQT